MEYKKYHFYQVLFTIGKKCKRPNMEIGKNYKICVKAENIQEVQAHIEAELNAEDIMIKSIVMDVCSLTDAEKAALVIDRL